MRFSMCGRVRIAVNPMSLYKRGDVWLYKFAWRSEAIRECTKQSNKRTAEQIESARRFWYKLREVRNDGSCRASYPSRSCSKVGTSTRRSWCYVYAGTSASN